MPDDNNQANDVEDHDEGCDDLCDHHIELDEDEITGDEDLPAATGGVEE